MSTLMTVIEAIKSVVSFIKLFVVELEKIRDRMLDNRVAKEKAERAKLIAELKAAKEKGASDDEIRKIHKRISALDTNGV